MDFYRERTSYISELLQRLSLPDLILTPNMMLVLCMRTTRLFSPLKPNLQMSSTCRAQAATAALFNNTGNMVGLNDLSTRTLAMATHLNPPAMASVLILD